MRYEFLINEISDFWRSVIIATLIIVMVITILVVRHFTQISLRAMQDNHFLLAQRCSQAEKVLESLRKSSVKLEPQPTAEWYKIFVMLSEKNHLNLYQWHIEPCHCKSEECFTPAELSLSGSFYFILSFLQEVAKLEGLIQKEVRVKEDHHILQLNLKLKLYMGSSCRING